MMMMMIYLFINIINILLLPNNSAKIQNKNGRMYSLNSSATIRSVSKNRSTSVSSQISLIVLKEKRRIIPKDNSCPCIAEITIFWKPFHHCIYVVDETSCLIPSKKSILNFPNSLSQSSEWKASNFFILQVELLWCHLCRLSANMECL